jgi:hypothetical protein
MPALLAGEPMAASVHYIKSHYRGSPVRPPAQRVAYEAAERRDTVFGLGMLAGILVFVVIGVWLISGVAAVGRSNNDCLQSARRVCGITSHGPWAMRFL